MARKKYRAIGPVQLKSNLNVDKISNKQFTQEQKFANFSLAIINLMKIYSAINDLLPEAKRLLEEASHKIVVRDKDIPRPEENELIQLVKEYEGLIIGVKEIMTQRVYQSIGNKLRFIGTLSIGTDHISDEFKQHSSIKILNCNTSNVPSVTEFIFGLIFQLVKKFPEQHEYTLGKIDAEPKGADIYGKYLGVVGAGTIARKVIDVADVFGMSILCWTFNPEKHKDLEKKGVQFVSIAELFRISEIVTINIPLTNESKHIVNKDLLDRMRPNSILINTSRLEIVDTDYLLDLLKNKKILGAGLDGDFTKKQIQTIKTLDNVIVSSHVAGRNTDANSRIDMDMAHQIIINSDIDGNWVG